MTAAAPVHARHPRPLAAVAGCAVLVLALLAGGCATPPRPAGEAPWQQGRLTVRAAATETRAAIAETAAFELQGDGTRGELRLNSPLGTRVARARWGDGEVVLESAGGERRFDDLDALARELLGEPLPLGALPDWLAGRPWAAAPSRPTAAGFEQLGWAVDLGRLDAGWIEARRVAPPALSLRVKLDAAS